MSSCAEITQLAIRHSVDFFVLFTYPNFFGRFSADSEFGCRCRLLDMITFYLHDKDLTTDQFDWFVVWRKMQWKKTIHLYWRLWNELTWCQMLFKQDKQYITPTRWQSGCVSCWLGIECWWLSLFLCYIQPPLMQELTDASAILPAPWAADHHKWCFLDDFRNITIMSSQFDSDFFVDPKLCFVLLLFPVPSFYSMWPN